MDAQSYTAQERRAANQVWAAAGAYGFEPLFLAHNTDGTIDFYMNCIVGLVHKYYGDALIREKLQKPVIKNKIVNHSVRRSQRKRKKIETKETIIM